MCGSVRNTVFIIYTPPLWCCGTGRIDRKIEFPLPDEKTRRRIFQIHTSKMTLASDLDLEEYITAKDDLSGADIKVSILSCTLFAYTRTCIYITNCKGASRAWGVLCLRTTLCCCEADNYASL